MKNSNQASLVPSKKGITRREGMMLTVLGSALLMAGCGGGGGGTTTAAGTTGGVAGSSASGAITGFGSIIVGGVRYDDSTATSIKDDDDVTRTSKELKMGMVVKIKGGKKYKDGASTKASCDSIEVHSELVGPIDSFIDTTAAKSIVVLGQTVDIPATTFFDDGLTFASLVAGNVTSKVVEVYGFVDPITKALVATRVELKATPKAFKLQGPISALNTVTKTFKIGSLVIAYTDLVVTPNLVLKDGLVVRVRLDITPLTGTRTALKIRAPENKHDDSDEAEVEGFITAFTSNALFSVNGLVVNTSATTKFDYPVGTMLKVGDRVEVEGSIVNGVLVAKKVELEGGEDAAKFELHGTLSLLNTTAKTFVLRGVTVNYGSATFAIGVTALTLANGINIEVKGKGSAGNVIVATQISLDR